MKGMLWKWTNYFSGWQPRWFVLDNGILSYYSCQDDVCNGCKGSIKISACDVSVHSRDASRLDLIIPGEAHFYLKASSPQERQQWLIALGTAKACLANAPRTPSPSPLEAMPDDTLKMKKSELRIYCDLLMQQVHGVKCAVQAKDNIDVEQLNESTSLLRATCDTFIQTLDDCVKLAHAKFDANPADEARSSSIGIKITGSRVKRSSSRQQSSSPDSCPPTSPGWFQRELSDGLQSGSSAKAEATMPPECHALAFETAKADDNEESETQTNLLLASPNLSDSRVKSFFTSMPISFLDIQLTSDGEIPTVPFLDACRSGLIIFDKLNQTAFAPAKLDIVGNIKKVHQKFLSNPGTFGTLQKIVRFELQAGQSHLSSSATMALLWLNRSLQFINEVIVGFLANDSEEDLVPIASTAYSKTLMPYHGWVVRGAFAMAVKSSPTRTELLDSLASVPSLVHHPSFKQSVIHDMADYSTALSAVTQILHSLFENNNLNFADQV